VPQSPRKPYDAREVIARVVDGSDFEEFKQLSARRSSRASPTSADFRSASSANNGILFSESALKARTSSSSAPRAHTPAFPAEHHRFMVGRKAEAGGIARRWREDGRRPWRPHACRSSR